ncbi:MAG: hypothetical protein II073_00575 [Lachnospiraceae bacterium]|nr:hypothetical protein [Lachnospiraceae bacterium]
MKLGIDLPSISAFWILVILIMVALLNQKERKFWLEVICIYSSLTFAIIGTFYPMHFYLINDHIPFRYMGVKPFHSLQFLDNTVKYPFLFWNIILFIPFGFIIFTMFKNKLLQMLLYIVTVICFSILIYIENIHSGVTQFSWDLGIAAMHFLSCLLGVAFAYLYQIQKRRCH